MIFSSLEFLFFFFPIVFIGYFFIKPEFANFWLLISSLLFYYISDKSHISLLFWVILIAYFAGLFMQLCELKWLRRLFMFMAVGVLLLVMSYYKYWNFIIENINYIFGKEIAYRNIVFPIGISFYIFQALSYVIDVYRGEKALRNPIDMALYISFFPQLIAGPIVRFYDVHEYMDKKYRKIDKNNIENGLWRFCIGLSIMVS